jgi:succinoglycan biosynthesis transport protein ExoP
MTRNPMSSAGAVEDVPVPFSDYFRVLTRHKALLVIGLVLGLLAGFTFAHLESKSFQSTGSVTVGPQTTSITSGTSSAPPNLITEAQRAHSSPIATAALANITTKSGVKPAQGKLLGSYSVAPITKSTLLQFQCTASRAADAQVACQALMNAYVADRVEAANAQLKANIKLLTVRRDAAVTAFNDANTAVGNAAAGSSASVLLKSQATAATTALDKANADLLGQENLQVHPAAVLAPAGKGQITGTSKSIILLAGALVGLVLAMAIAFLIDRADDRLRASDDIERLGLPLVGELPRPTGADQQALNEPANWPAAKRRAYGKLAARILVASRRRELSVITLMGVGDSATDRLVAANLAVALAQAGSRVNLVLTGGGVSSPAATADPATGAPSQGGTAALATRSPELLPSPVQGLHFTELAQVNGTVNMDAADFLSGDLRRGADFVVVAAPPVVSTADSLVLASVSDAVILVTNEKVSRRAELLEASDSLLQIAAPLFGVVFTQRLSRKAKNKGHVAEQKSGGSLNVMDVPDLETIRQH